MMRRLEIIRVRLLGRCSRRLMEAIRKSALTKNDDIEMNIFQQNGVTTDIGIHLHYTTENNDQPPCELGVHLASALKEHGMVELTIWNEEKEEIG